MKLSAKKGIVLLVAYRTMRLLLYPVVAVSRAFVPSEAITVGVVTIAVAEFFSLALMSTHCTGVTPLVIAVAGLIAGLSFIHWRDDLDVRDPED